MRNCYLDANVLVYYKNEESPFFRKADAILHYLVENGWNLFISPLVLDEFLYAISILLQKKEPKKSDVFRLLKETLKEVLALPNLKIINPPLTKRAQLKVVPLMEKFNLRPRDAYHLSIMQVNNIQSFATFDDDFRAVFGQKSLSPIKP